MATIEDIKVVGIPIGFKVVLEHEEAEGIGNGVISASSILPEPAATIVAALGLILKTICKMGGHDGVEVIHSFGQTVALPR